MFCLLCGSGNEAEFAAEMLIHFNDLKNVDKPVVWLFPEVLVCMHCGFARFKVPATELALLTVSPRVTARERGVLIPPGGRDKSR